MWMITRSSGRGVQHTLEATKDIEVIGEAPDGQRAIQMAESLAPYLMLIDINLPGLNGLGVAGRPPPSAANRSNYPDRVRGR